MVPALQVDTSCETPVRCSQCPTKVRWSSSPAILLFSQSPICEGSSKNERGVWCVFTIHHIKFRTGEHQCWKSCGVHGYGSIEQGNINAGDHKIWEHNIAHYCMMSNGNPAAFIATISPETRKPYSLTPGELLSLTKMAWKTCHTLPWKLRGPLKVWGMWISQRQCVWLLMCALSPWDGMVCHPNDKLHNTTVKQMS